MDNVKVTTTGPQEWSIFADVTYFGQVTRQRVFQAIGPRAVFACTDWLVGQRS